LSSFWLILKQQWTIEDISIFSNSSHVEWRAGLSDTMEWSLDGPLPKLYPVIPTSNQNGCQAYRLCKLGIFQKKKTIKIYFNNMNWFFICMLKIIWKSVIMLQILPNETDWIFWDCIVSTLFFFLIFEVTILLKFQLRKNPYLLTFKMFLNVSHISVRYSYQASIVTQRQFGPTTFMNIIIMSPLRTKGDILF
jgi:hypothetical protein